jgi:putative transposase
MGDQTRFQRWESGLIAAPDLLFERDLDICLMKQHSHFEQKIR